MLNKVVAMSRDRAEEVKPNTWSKLPTAIISIGNRSSQPAQLSGAFAKILRTNFEFVDGAWRRPNDGGPTEEQAREIVEFIESLVNDKETTYDLIVHCGEGRFRSTGVACFIDFMFECGEVSAAEKDAKVGNGSTSLIRDLVNAHDR
jgi:predicted protein tyrosine phosphatase